MTTKWKKCLHQSKVYRKLIRKRFSLFMNGPLVFENDYTDSWIDSGSFY